ncbi:hypothetical protein BKA56DRAFT_558426 [Ilyonectria sp. MPI-CAGE-AT-0026]|nr:hypothetical protein BKA56DRAFT_558426 [Ilyonectria sp. MPI-CAGE-AT-0026]
MKRSVGPLDKRRRITRCQPCAKRRIKCEGGCPCQYCIRTNKACQPQKPAPHQTKFIVVQDPSSAYQTTMPAQAHKLRDDIYLDHFVSFIQRCQFTRGFASATADIVRRIHTSQPLRDLTLAIGALEASRTPSVRCSLFRDSPLCIAFSFYGKSMQTLNHKLETTDALHCDDVLWSTFLLGLFELMTEASGEQWAKHMLYGTSMIFQLGGPKKRLSAVGEKLFSAFRVLEAHRAIIYGDHTFLSQDSWIKYQASLATKPPEPNESILEIMIRISSFAQRLFETMEAVPDPIRSAHPEIDALTREGVHLLQQLRTWHDETTLHDIALDTYSTLALTNYHTLVLFHCGNFTYYSGWEKNTSLLLTKVEIDEHIDAIISLSGSILEQSTIPSALLLFGLRVAGANSSLTGHKEMISATLSRIHQKGFVVSDRIKIDLEEFWKYQLLIKN